MAYSFDAKTSKEKPIYEVNNNYVDYGVGINGVVFQLNNPVEIFVPVFDVPKDFNIDWMVNDIICKIKAISPNFVDNKDTVKAIVYYNNDKPTLGICKFGMLVRVPK